MVKRSLSRLQTYYSDLDSHELLKVAINEEFKNEIALVSSFGVGSAILISMVIEVNPEVPILFLDTGKHFPETLDYLRNLEKSLGIKNLILLKPDKKIEEEIDPNGDLWSVTPNRCCWFRKVKPLQDSLQQMNIQAVITGRKRYQTSDRQNMDSIELSEDGRYKINPLASWSSDDIKKEFKKRKLLEHPLVLDGYLSIGCLPCTRAVKQGEDERAGRWSHTAGFPGGEKKTECGIHLPSSSSKPDWNI